MQEHWQATHGNAAVELVIQAAQDLCKVSGGGGLEAEALTETA